MKTLYLIDGYAQFFRAYHAIRTRMTSPVTGEPTNMTFGFVGMLLKLLKRDAAQLQGDGDPTYLAVALDIGGDRGTFRSTLYPDYKATRSEPPEDLGPQVERALKILELIGVPVLGVEGFEADDVIATIATSFSARHPDVRVRIISKDKDLKQLLGSGTPHTEMYDIHTDVLITEQTLKDELGITPAQVIDMLTLMGDTVDNVPGVPGIGPKTAAQLIAEHGTLEAVIAAAESGVIKGKKGENIVAARATMPLSRQLVSLRHDVPIDLDLEAARTDRLRLAELMPVLRELGFNRYQDELKTLLGQPSDTPPTSKPKAQGSQSLGFGTLFEQSSPAEVRAVSGDYHTIRTQAELDSLIARTRTAAVVAVDTETTHIRPMLAQLAGVSISVAPGEGFYIPVRSPEPSSHLDEAAVLSALRPVLEDPSIPTVGHNLKFDLNILHNAGISLRGHLPTDAAPAAGDTMIASYILDASRSSHSMDALAMAMLNRQNISIKDLIGSGKVQKRFDEVPLAQAGPYAAEDADVTLQLDHALSAQLAAEPSLARLYREVEMPLVDTLAALERNGVLIDPDELDRQRERLQSRIEDLARQIDSAALDAIDRTFDHNSPKQLGEALFNKPDADRPGLGLKPIKKTKTGYSTDAEVLEKLAADDTIETTIPRLILEYRQLTKLVNTYLVALKEEIHPVTKRIHASFNQTVAVTGRLSSSDPNLQNIPIRTEIGRDIRKAFIAPPAHALITADYSQIELRVLAHLSQDPALIAAFLAGEDIHTAVAAQIHGVPLEQVSREQRSGAKMVNFGIVYGVTPYGLARRLGISNTEAGEIIDGYKKRFANITTFLAECIQQAVDRGFVETMLGRRRPIPEIESTNPQRRALAERTAINSVVQGSAADLIKLAMIDLHRRLEVATPSDPLGGTRMILQIHDELVFETPLDKVEAATPVIVERMEAAMTLLVPLQVDAHAGEKLVRGQMMAYLPPLSNREIGRRMEKLSIDSVIAYLDAQLIEQREAPDALISTATGKLALEVTELRPDPRTVAADITGLRLLDHLYDHWLENADLQTISLSLAFRIQGGSVFTDGIELVQTEIARELASLAREIRAHIADNDWASVQFLRQQAVLRIPSTRPKVELRTPAISLETFFTRASFRRHDHVRILTPTSNISAGPRGNWRAQAEQCFAAKLAKAPDYRRNIDAGTGLGLVVNGNTPHRGFLGFDEQIAAAGMLFARLNADHGHPFDAIFVTGPVYYPSDYQMVVESCPWTGLAR